MDGLGIAAGHAPVVGQSSGRVSGCLTARVTSPAARGSRRAATLRVARRRTARPWLGWPGRAVRPSLAFRRHPSSETTPGRWANSGDPGASPDTDWEVRLWISMTD
ncbi:hypothetical protein GCM10022214_08500 [Actinomadura miaoliensis]|uniref:Uncharacterized protein n=1 Tax=Actinomadura miaoliensis TaxID=430685 RepID=A0ABP7V5D4_9ACTN